MLTLFLSLLALVEASYVQRGIAFLAFPAYGFLSYEMNKGMKQ